MPITDTTYTAEALVAGPVVTRDNLPVANDTYHIGMPLALTPTVTAGTNTGTGLCKIVSGKPIRTFIVEFTAALVVKIVEGTTAMATGIAITAGTGSRTLITYAGCTVVIDVTATAFVSGDTFTVAAGLRYAYDAVNVEAIYAGPNARVVGGGAGVAGAIIAGQVDGSKVVDDSGTALAITEQMRTNAALFNIYFK